MGTRNEWSNGKIGGFERRIGQKSSQEHGSTRGANRSCGSGSRISGTFEIISVNWVFE